MKQNSSKKMTSDCTAWRCVGCGRKHTTKAEQVDVCQGATQITEIEYKTKPKQPKPGDVVEYLETYEGYFSWGKFDHIDDDDLIWVLTNSDGIEDNTCLDTVDAWRWPGEKEWRR